MLRSSLKLAVALWLAGAVTGLVSGQEKPKVQVAIPNPGVPEVMTIEGKFVRAAYNNEGYVIIGYQVANRSIGDEWMMLDLGTTVRDNTPEYTLKREHLSVDIPSGKTIPLATTEAYRKANLRAVEQRARVQRDSINYFPPMASRPCGLLFFPDLTSRALPVEWTELSKLRACVGRLFFKIPGGIAHGQHWLNVKFQNSVLRVPFRILTKDEEKFLSKNYKSIDKQVKEAFKPKK